MQDCTVIYYDGDFRDRRKKQDSLEKEMIQRFGRNKPNDFRYRLSIEDNCIIATHRSERELVNR